jgi:glutathione S-transferase
MTTAAPASTPVLRLHGFALSNYYNKVKLVLLEKGLAFEEVEVLPRGGEDVLVNSPLGKLPYLVTPHGPLCESAVIVDYLEAAYPEVPLVPADPFAAAKVRELSLFMDLHLELVARMLYAQAFFGGKVSEGTIAKARGQLEKNIAAFKRLARFAPYVAGDTFTLADCTAVAHLPLVAMATKLVCGEDLLAAQGVDWKGYVKLIEQRPTAQKVAADRKADQQRAAQLAAMGKVPA